LKPLPVAISVTQLFLVFPHVVQSVLRPGCWLNDRDSGCHRVQTGLEVHPASYPMGTGDLTSAVKRSDREADHSLYLASRLRMRGAIPPFPNTLNDMVVG